MDFKFSFHTLVWLKEKDLCYYIFSLTTPWNSDNPRYGFPSVPKLQSCFSVLEAGAKERSQKAIFFVTCNNNCPLFMWESITWIAMLQPETVSKATTHRVWRRFLAVVSGKPVTSPRQCEVSFVLVKLQKGSRLGQVPTQRGCLFQDCGNVLIWRC